jgi:hypothetical protein
MPPNMIRDARFADDAPYRYWLTRTWERRRPILGWCGLNPSTAGAVRDDQTIRRVVDFSDVWGYGGVVMLNLFALITTNPARLVQHADPIGPENDEYLWALTDGIDVIACWGGGVPDYWRPRARAIAHRLRRERTTFHLGLTKAGEPRHPSRLARSTERTRWLAA